MKKLIAILILLLAPIAGFLISCGNNSPTSSNSATATPVPATSTPTPSIKTLVNFNSAAASIIGLCVDNSGNVFAADYNGAGATSHFVKVTSAGVTTQLFQVNSVSDVATDGTNEYLGSANSPYFYYYSGGVTTAPLFLTTGFTTAITGVAVNSSATTLALSTGGAVSFYSLPSFTYIGSTTPPSGISGSEAIAYDNSGNLYVAQSTLIIKYSVGVSGATTIAGQTGAGGYIDGAATTNAKFNGIQAIAVDHSGNIFVADSSNNAIREVSGSTVTTLLGPTGAGVTPTLTSPTIVGPDGIAVDGSGNVFFADRSNSPNNHIFEYIP